MCIYCNSVVSAHIISAEQGYDGSRKDTTICAIESHQEHNDRSWEWPS